jgi:seryl-tRNA synthetase
MADGFQFLGAPALAPKAAFINTGHFPFGQEDAFEIPRDHVCLVGTAEIVLNSLHSGEILVEADLPLLYAGFSPCFRREAGRVAETSAACCGSISSIRSSSS